MMTNTENPTGKIRVAMAKSAVQALITGAFTAIIYVIISYSIGYLFSIHFSTPQGITLAAFFGATTGAAVYLRGWAMLIILMTSISFGVFSTIYIPRLVEENFVVVLIVPLLLIAAVAWRPLRRPHPRQGVVFVDWSNWFFRRKGT